MNLYTDMSHDCAFARDQVIKVLDNFEGLISARHCLVLHAGNCLFLHFLVLDHQKIKQSLLISSIY